MNILLASAEIAPWAKVGGLADVVGSLPKALGRLGHDCVVAIPAYGYLVQELRDKIVETKSGFSVQTNHHSKGMAVVHRVQLDEFEVWLIDGEDRFRSVTKGEDIYTPQRDDYLFFSHAILAACRVLGWKPDVVHAHDWQLGLLPAIMREVYRWEWIRTASCFTIHNFAHQGEFGIDTLDAAGLSRDLFSYDRLETYGGVNFLKSACVYADMVNTVSPTYANEITLDEQGGRLKGLMAFMKGRGRLRGILNGIDTASHDPLTDPCLPANFSADDLSGKAECRKFLIDSLQLKADKNSLVCGMISRLSEQKGFDLLVEAAPSMIQAGAVIVIQALGSPFLAGKLAEIQRAFPGRFIHVSAFDPVLAQRIYGGCDAFLMPSHFEPCGLGQMFAMRYGTVPIVRHTGGLADTVLEGVTGFSFAARDSSQFAHAVHRAIDAHSRPSVWSSIVRSAMVSDWSWDHSAPEYVKMYQDALEARQSSAA
jgi:starch synthase